MPWPINHNVFDGLYALGLTQARLKFQWLNVNNPYSVCYRLNWHLLNFGSILKIPILD